MPFSTRWFGLLLAPLSIAAAAPGKVVPMAPQTLDADGVKVEFTAIPASGADLMEGADAQVQFRISDKLANTPLTGLHPAAWIDMKKEAGAGCEKKIESFLQASLSARADIDLNAYFVLALNDDATLTVVDPLFGYGGSKLLAYLELKTRGDDWRLLKNQSRLFVSMPDSGEVAVISTATWKQIGSVAVGHGARRLALQSDEKYLWVARDGGVTVVDARNLNVVARIETGAGRHDIALSADDRHAFVTNQRSGTLVAIRVADLAKEKTLRTGPSPIALAFSSLSKSVYVADGEDGTIAVVDEGRLELVSRMKGRGPLSTVRFAPGGRWGFAIAPGAGVAQVFDSAANRIVHTAAAGKGPDQVAFTSSYAFVRQTGAETVSLIDLGQLARPGSLSVADFPGGQAAPGRNDGRMEADAIVPSPEGASVLLANPRDRTIYFYQEGMAAPMGSFQNYGHEPRAVMVVDRSLRETAPGVYSAPVRLTAAGEYDAALLVSTPRLTHCFPLTIKANPAIPRHTEPLALTPMLSDRRVPVGKPFPLRFKLTDPATGLPRANLEDVRVLALSPGVWQRRELARSVGGGVYEIDMRLPQSGVYYVFYEVPSLRVPFPRLPGMVLYADDRPAASTTASASGGAR
ncbi:MAG TPA: YncE family protein [Myxococcales bacterium]